MIGLHNAILELYKHHHFTPFDKNYLFFAFESPMARDRAHVHIDMIRLYNDMLVYRLGQRHLQDPGAVESSYLTMVQWQICIFIQCIAVVILYVRGK